jgi:hypothetical protein
MAKRLPKNYGLRYAEWTRLLDDQKSAEADTLYFEELLPLILPLVRQRSPISNRYSGLISVLGFTPETVVLAARLLEPHTLVVLHTPETQQHLETVRKYCGVPLGDFYHEQFLHDREHTNDIYLALKRSLARFRPGESLAIELTGGKKTMGMQLANAAAALRHSSHVDVDVVYIDYDEYIPKYRKPLPETSRLLILEDPPADAYNVFGDVALGELRSSELLATPIFRGRGFEVDSESAFVLMPFGEKWSDRIWRLIKEECSVCGFKPTRADDLFGNDLMEDIWKGISTAAVVIADLTTRNPNVFYELGLVHTVGKNFILLTQDIADLPFDLRRYRCIEYEDNADGYESLRKGLHSRLEAGPGSAPNRVGGGFSPPPPTPPSMRVRTGRFTADEQARPMGLI